MKNRITISLLVSLFCYNFLVAQAGYQIRVVSSEPDQITLDIEVPSFLQREVALEPLATGQFTPELNNRGKVITINGATPMLRKGMPDLPKLTATLQLDRTGHYTAEVVSTEFEDYTNIAVAPSKGNLSRKVNPATVPFAFGEVYAAKEFYPAQLAEAQAPFILRDTRGMSLWIYPVQYQPSTQTVRLHKKMRIKLTRTAERGAQELQEPMTHVKSETFSDICRRLYINTPQKNFETHAQRGTSSTPERMLVICPDAFVTELEPLVTWKRQMGIHTTVVTASELQGTDTTRVIDYVRNAYLNDGITYLLVVGDESTFPPPMRLDGSPFSCDNCLGYISGNDYLPEVLVGRFHASTVEELRTMVARSLEYEKSPVADASSPWMSRMIWAASDEGAGIGDDGQSDYAHANEWKATHLADGCGDAYELYDGDHSAISPTPGHYTADKPGNPVNTEIVALLSGPGAGLYNYTGHGWLEGLATGNFNTSAVGSLTNNGKYPILIGVACCAGDFTDPTAECLGEVLQRAGNQSTQQPFGTIAAFLSSDYQSWAPPMEGQDGMNQYLVDADGVQLHPTIGGMGAYGMGRMIQAYQQAGEIMAGFWNPFHEPSFVPRTRLPAEFSDITVPSQVFIGETSVTVSCPVEGALVGVYFKGQTIGAGRIAGGTATVSFPALNDVGDLIITFSQFNYLPVQRVISVTPQSGPFVVQHSYQLLEQNGNGDSQVDYNEAFTISHVLRNVGLTTSGAIQTTLSTTSPFVQITKATAFYNTIPAGAEISNPAAFSFKVRDSIPDGHTVVFRLSIDYGSAQPYESGFSVKLHAPRLQVGNLRIDDSFSGNNNGRLESGESVVVRIENTNIGSSGSPYAFGHLVCNSPYVTVVPMSAVGQIDKSGGSKPAQFNVTVAQNAPTSHQIAFDYRIEADKYTAEKQFDQIVVNAIIAHFNGGDGFGGFQFAQADDKPWTITTAQPYEGTHCARSGVISNNKKSTLTLSIKVLEAGNVSFARRVSSEADYDFLRFYIDGAEKGAWSGHKPWEEFSFPLTVGNHLLKWSYIKDDLIAEGSDAAWIDAILLPPIEQISSIFDTEVTNSGGTVVPNPVADRTTLYYTLKEADHLSIDIYDAFGKFLFNALPKSRVSEGNWVEELDFSNRPAGVYFIQIQGNKTASVHKVVKY